MNFTQKLLAIEQLSYSPEDYQLIWSEKSYNRIPKSKFAVCIPTYRRANQLSKLLRAIYDLRHANKNSLKVPFLISINGNPVEYQDLINKYEGQSGIEFIVNNGAQTFSGNLSNLIHYCKSEYSLLMGDDDWVSNYLDLVNEALIHVSPDSIVPFFAQNTALQKIN